MRAKLEGDEAKMCLYALQSGMLDEAHSIFFEKVAPNMIISGTFIFHMQNIKDFFIIQHLGCNSSENEKKKTA